MPCIVKIPSESNVYYLPFKSNKESVASLNGITLKIINKQSHAIITLKVVIILPLQASRLHDHHGKTSVQRGRECSCGTSIEIHH